MDYFACKEIRRARTKLGLTQAEFAKLCGIHQETVCRYESGSRKANLYTLQKIALLCEEFSLDRAIGAK